MPKQTFTSAPTVPTQQYPPPPRAFRVLGCNLRVWQQEVEQSPFYVASDKARHAYVDGQDTLITGDADPNALPRGPEAVAAAERLVIEKAREFQLAYSDVMGKCCLLPAPVQPARPCKCLCLEPTLGIGVDQQWPEILWPLQALRRPARLPTWWQRSTAWPA